MHSTPLSPIERAIAYFGNATDLAKALDVSSAAVSGWKTADRPIPPKQCVEIEKLVDARVTVEELSPRSKWVRVPDVQWPHPKGRPLMDVAAADADAKAGT
jgi:DNA-binding transcriptional regulator YdaS (Cro superfamily)